jgi:hypothetical protein
MKLGPSEWLAHSTVRIECDVPGGIGTGTGFFYALNKNGDWHVPVIVTNKHVVAGATKGRFCLTLQDAVGGPSVGAFQTFELDAFEQRWLPHPDPDIDLCVMPIAPLLREAERRNQKFFYAPFDKDFIPTIKEIEDMIGLDSITMIGYPNGFWDTKNNLPIFRRGVLATDYKYDWRGRKEFLIDAACFPGSSGSPVMLFDSAGYQTRKGIFMGQSRLKLLGVLYAGLQHTVEGEVRIVLLPTQQKAVAISGIPNNLGVVIKAEKLLAFEGIFR